MEWKGKRVSAVAEDSILQSYLSLGGGLVLARLVAFVGTAYLTRTLGSYAFGIVGFATALAGFLAIGLRNSVEPVGAREVAKDPEAATSLAAGVTVIRSILVILATALLAVVAAFLDKPDEVRLVVLLSGLTLLPLAIDTRWVYWGLARNRWVGVSMVLAQTIYVVTLLLVVRSPDDVIWVLPALALGELVGVTYLAAPLLREWKDGLDLARAWGIVRSSGFLVSSGVLGALTRTTDIVLIGLILGESDVGLFSAAYRICFLVLALGAALQSAYLPRLARAAQNGPEAASALTQRASHAAASLAIPVVVGGWILAGPMLEGLFGQPFGAARDAFRLLILAMGIIFVHGIYLKVVVVFDRTRPELWIRAGTATMNLILNLLWIPRYGIEGAAMATVLVESTVLVSRLLVGRRLGVKVSGGFLVRPLLAAGLMAAIMLAIHRVAPWWMTLIAGGASYVLALAGLRGLPGDLLPGSWRSS